MRDNKTVKEERFKQAYKYTEHVHTKVHRTGIGSGGLTARSKDNGMEMWTRRGLGANMWFKE